MSTLIFEAKSRDSAVVLIPHGEVDLETQHVFEATVCTAVTSRPVVVDLSRVRFLAISALHALIRAQRTADAHRQQLLYVDPPPPVRMVLALSQADQHLNLQHRDPAPVAAVPSVASVASVASAPSVPPRAG